MAEGAVVFGDVGGVKVWAHDGITDHDAKVDEFTYSLEDGIDTEPDVVKDYL